MMVTSHSPIHRRNKGHHHASWPPRPRPWVVYFAAYLTFLVLTIYYDAPIGGDDQLTSEPQPHSNGGAFLLTPVSSASLREINDSNLHIFLREARQRQAAVAAAETANAALPPGSRIARSNLPDRVRLVVLGPANDTLPYSLHKILPAILYATRRLEASRSLIQVPFEVVYRDTQCSSTFGPLAAFEFYTSGAAHVFFGPLCPYVLAPVARYASVWNLPILTAGGQNDVFDAKSPHYRLLTRMNGRYSQIAYILLQVLRKFHWTVSGLLLHNHEDRTKGHSDCFFSLGPYFSMVGNRPFHRTFDENNPNIDFKTLLQEASKRARGKTHSDPRRDSKRNIGDEISCEKSEGKISDRKIGKKI